MAWDVGLGGALVSAFGAYTGAKSANRAAKKQAQVDWDRAREAYRTRYQFQMADMRKAGLNPILAYQNPPPGGPAPPPLHGFRSAGGEAAAAGSAGLREGSAAALRREEMSLARATRGKTVSEAARTRADTDFVRERTREAASAADIRRIETDIARSRRVVASSEAVSARALEDFFEKNPEMRVLRDLLGPMGGLLGGGAKALGNFLNPGRR